VRVTLLDRFIDPQAGLRRHAVLWTLAFCLLQVVEEALLDRFGTSDQIIGVTGAISVLLAVAAGVFIGVRSGVVVAVVGTGAFYVWVSEFGAATPVASTIAAGMVWTAAAVLAGLVADSLRHEIVARRSAREEVVSLHERLTSNLLPSVPERMGRCRIVSFYRPGEERMDLGGDFYDVLELDRGRVAAVIGDVSGHGPDAAGLGVILRASWQALVRTGVDEATLVAAMTAVLERETASIDSFATLCMATVDTRASSVRLLLLGHPPPLLVTDSVSSLEGAPLPPVGVMAPEHVVASESGLPREWSLFFYTDGLVEGRAEPGGAERYGVERLVARLTRDCAAGPGALDAASCLESIVSDVEAANGGPLPDDVAVLLLTGGTGDVAG
jgi:serine phosphatase RsbU (regulator of sigma subunit)